MLPVDCLFMLRFEHIWLSSTGKQGAPSEAGSSSPPNEKIWSKNNIKIGITIEHWHNNRKLCENRFGPLPRKILERSQNIYLLPSYSKQLFVCWNDMGWTWCIYRKGSAEYFFWGGGGDRVAECGKSVFVWVLTIGNVFFGLLNKCCIFVFYILNSIF